MKTTLLILLTLITGPGLLHAQNTPIISEFMASNLEALDDDDGDASDWIEFYNPGGAVYNLAEHFLTDDRRNLRKWKVPGNLNLSPGGYGLIFASGKDRGGLFSATFHTNFELSSNGEYLALVAPDGETILSEYADQYPRQRTGISFGIGNNEAGGEEWRYFESPSPEAANGDGRAELPPRVADTKFSLKRGFYEEPITVEITTATEDAIIYYSLDGSDPGPGSVFNPGLRFTEPIAIDKTTLLRARAYKDGLEPTNIDTQTYLFISSVLEQADEQPGLPDRWNGERADYGMDPDIVEATAYRDRIRDAFLDIPTLSIVTDKDNIWGPNGLYLNTTRSAPDGSGPDFQYEFEVSAELLNPDGSEGFQVQAGWRAQGGASRNADRSPKHAMSLRFRRVYGTGRLNYPLLKDSPQQSFNAIHLRARYNNSWIHSNGDQRNRAQYMRDQWARDAMIEMGTPAAGHGNYIHLYLNGLYWGIYNIHERLDSAHYADYYGGRRDAVDAVNGGRATSGDLTSYNAMRDAARSKDWEAITQRLDIDNYIDWHIIQRFASNRDLKNDGNWKAAGGGSSNALWRFFAWDTERILEGLRDGVPTPSSDPSGILSSLDDIPEFVQRFGDRLHKHLFNGGALTPARNIARWEKRAEELDLAIIAESARWGDYRRSAPYERDREWLTEQKRLIEDYFPERTNEVIDQFQNAGLYPKTLGVDLNQFGGRVPSGFELILSSEGFSVFNPGKIYFTTDGSDPLSGDGDIGDTAVEYVDPVILNSSTVFKARVLSAQGEWSALTETFFAVGTEPAGSASLIVSELMYHPGPPTAEESAAGHVDSDDFEYIEFHNVSDQTLDLAGVTVDDGVRFAFLAGPDAILEPGARSVIVRDEAAFRYRYGDVPHVSGVYGGGLANGGERIRLLDENGAEILSFSYDDGGAWPLTADGTGFSLVLIEAETGVDPDKGTSWRASAKPGGSPGVADEEVTYAVVINEILTNPKPPDVDAIELFNAGNEPVDVSGWFLTDDVDVPAKFAIPAETIISAGGYLVIKADNDGDPENNADLPDGYFGNDFGLSSRGESVHLFSANAEGQLTGYSDGFSFGAAEEDVTFGRHIDSQGRIQYPPQASPSLGAANTMPAVGEVVISEIMYHSTLTSDTDDLGEYLELFNRSDAVISLDGWRISGIRYTFPQGTTIGPREVILVTRAGAGSFSNFYNVPDEVTIVGPYEGRLDNDGERITLQRPGETYMDNDVEKVTMIAVDSVRYNDAEPWPQAADGQGRSLERKDLDAYADEVENWMASAEEQGSPGVVEDSGDPGPAELTFVQWQTANFSSAQLSDATVVGGLADPDGDRLANRLEYVFGTDPLMNDPAQVVVERVGSEITILYPRRRSMTGMSVTPQTSLDLEAWQDATDVITGTDVKIIDETREQVTLTLQIESPVRFLRLAVQEE